MKNETKNETAEKIACRICPHHCRLTEGQLGFCRARKNVGGKIVCLNYGRISSVALDPVEKKPFARWHTGKSILSVGSFGCNLHCSFCQNAGISQKGEECDTDYMAPHQIAEVAAELASIGNVGVAFTYNEPLIGYEYVMDTAQYVKADGFDVALVTNGTIETDLLRELLPRIDAMNIDLKAWNENFYRKIGGDFATVKNNIALAAENCHVEITTLIIPGENDDENDMDGEAAWLAGLSREIPLHISRFFPRYKMTDKPPTPVEKIYRLVDVAKRHLDFVYAGNC